MKKLVLAHISALILITLLAGCQEQPGFLPGPENRSTPTPFQPLAPTASPPRAETPSPTVYYTPTSTPAPTETALPTLTPTETPFACAETQGRVDRFEAAGPANPGEDAPPLTVRVYTPPCYEQRPEGNYPALYIFHGQTYTDDQWDRLGMDEAADELISSGQAPPFLIVMPLEEFTLPDPFETMHGYRVADELVPWIDRNFRTCAERSCRAIGGLSRGGGWAVHMGFTRWQLFGAIGAHSAPVFLNDPYRLRDWLKEIPPDQLPRIYLDNGRLDWYVVIEREFEALLVQLGVPHEYYVFEGRHDEEYWSSHVVDYLRFYTRSWN